MDQTRLLGLMERVAHPLRKAGLGPAVSAVRARLDKRFVATWTDVDGLQMIGRTIGHVAHLRAWQEGREEAHMTTLFSRRCGRATSFSTSGATSVTSRCSRRERRVPS